MASNQHGTAKLSNVQGSSIRRAQLAATGAESSHGRIKVAGGGFVGAGASPNDDSIMNSPVGGGASLVSSGYVYNRNYQGPTYAVKYLGIVDGTMGILSRKMALSTSQNPQALPQQYGASIQYSHQQSATSIQHQPPIKEVQRISCTSSGEAANSLVRAYKPVLDRNYTSKKRSPAEEEYLRQLQSNRQDLPQQAVTRNFLEADSPFQQSVQEIAYYTGSNTVTVNQEQPQPISNGQTQRREGSSFYMNLTKSEKHSEASKFLNPKPLVTQDSVAGESAEAPATADDTAKQTQQVSLHQTATSINGAGANVAAQQQLLLEQSLQSSEENALYTASGEVGGIFDTQSSLMTVVTQSHEQATGFPMPELYNQHYINKYSFPKGLVSFKRPEELRHNKYKQSIYDMKIAPNRKGVSGWKLTKHLPEISQQQLPKLSRTRPLGQSLQQQRGAKERLPLIQNPQLQPQSGEEYVRQSLPAGGLHHQQVAHHDSARHIMSQGYPQHYQEQSTIIAADAHLMGVPKLPSTNTAYDEYYLKYNESLLNPGASTDVRQPQYGLHEHLSIDEGGSGVTSASQQELN